jgi:hypothetical protein
MAFFGGGLYGLIGLITFIVLLARDWANCTGFGDCLVMVILAWLAGLFWPIYWIWRLIAGG